MTSKAIDYVPFLRHQRISVFLDSRLRHCRGPTFVTAVGLVAEVGLEQWLACHVLDPDIDDLLKRMAADLQQMRRENHEATKDLPPLEDGFNFRMALQPLLRRLPGDEEEHTELRGFLTPIEVSRFGERRHRYPLAVEFQLAIEQAVDVRVRLMNNRERVRSRRRLRKAGMVSKYASWYLPVPFRYPASPPCTA